VPDKVDENSLLDELPVLNDSEQPHVRSSELKEASEAEDVCPSPALPADDGLSPQPDLQKSSCDLTPPQVPSFSSFGQVHSLSNLLEASGAVPNTIKPWHATCPIRYILLDSCHASMCQLHVQIVCTGFLPQASKYMHVYGCTRVCAALLII
jgi:hypothetical protein